MTRRLVLLVAGTALFFLFCLLLGNRDVSGVKDLVVRRLKGNQDRSI